jgi:hypothetical protein
MRSHAHVCWTVACGLASTNVPLGFDDLAGIIAKYECGRLDQTARRAVRVSKSRNSARLRTHGVTLRRQGLTDEQVIEAANFYTADRSLAWLAVRYTVSPMTVSRALRHHGVTLRPRLVWS